ncbi:SKP1-interacting partner 15-like isoform X2 [Olea europaea var. sylvestris]|uniref:SKP1-interacting partner 15-like isoform X1 n=1 Tax=Olea europaea var. sylvestris TaxID=158386 RepID=UPI000C1D83D6|nr:SKP1-interacting partner 15-like isoform X1 [Olea europaea var. sylvestris]XP_022863697.1 SKP1-interacting partner 15-like isoform X2 [Olea europaea var. sylvestris]
MDSSPLNHLPEETIHQIFFQLPLRQIAACKCVCKALNSALSSPSFRHLLSAQHTSLSLLALKPSDRHISPFPNLHAFDPALSQWLRFSLSFLPFSSLHPITSSDGLLYLWAARPPSRNSNTAHVRNSSQKSLVVCNPLIGQFKILPQLGSAWSRHGSVLAGSGNTVLLLTELAILYYSESNGVNGAVNSGGVSCNWLKFTSNLPSKPRSPVMVSDSILALCDVGSPWRSQWAIYKTKITDMEKKKHWVRVEKRQWGDIFGILKRPRLVKAMNDKKVHMVGGLKSSFALHSSCTTILILRLDLESLEWEEVGRMPVEMYRCFMESSKFKVFGGGNKVCFSAKRVGKLVLWEETEEGKAEWRWIEGLSGHGDGLCRGFVYEARLDAVP